MNNMAYTIFANLTIGTENLTSKQQREVKNFILQKYNVLPIPEISNQWHFPIESYFSDAHEMVQNSLSELALKLNLKRLVFTLNFSTEKWNVKELSVANFQSENR